MGPIAWEVGSMFTLLVLAYYFLPKYLKMGAMTIPSLMEERYGKGTKTMFSLVIVVSTPSSTCRSPVTPVQSYLSRSSTFPASSHQ